MNYISHFFSKHKCPITSWMDGVPQLVTKVAFNMVVNKVKENYEGAT